MKRIDLEFIEIDTAKFKKRTALLSDVKNMIKEDVIIYVNNEPVLLYKNIKENTDDLRWAVKNIDYVEGVRTRGLKTTSAIFGYSPRIAMRHDYCTITSMAEKHPKQHHIISNYIKRVIQYYEEYFPEIFEQHKDIVYEKVLEEWKIGNTPFTSGIVNKNNQLKYHFDTGNFKGVLSNMVVFKKGTSGGHLVIPSLDLALEVSDNSLTIFNGQDILHGVSPIEYDTETGYRYSVVYYSLEQMWKCEPLGQEIDRIRNVKTVRERNRINPDHIATLEERKIELKNHSDKEMMNLKIKNNL